MTAFPDTTLATRCADLAARVLCLIARERADANRRSVSLLGRVVREIVEADGARVETWFHRNGKRRLVRTFAAGELAKVERFWRQGTRRTLGRVEHGCADGEWFLVKRDGSLDRARTGLYREGRWIGGIKGFNDWLGSA